MAYTIKQLAQLSGITTRSLKFQSSLTLLISIDLKTTSRTEKKRYSFEWSPRCGARTKGNNGEPCRCPAIRGKTRCRVHSGAKGSGAPRYNQNALKHGETTGDAKKFRKKIRMAIQRSKLLSQGLVDS